MISTFLSQTTQPNWAVGPEGISLAEGRELRWTGILVALEMAKCGLPLHRRQVQAETKRIIAETGTQMKPSSVPIVPFWVDIDEERIECSVK